MDKQFTPGPWTAQQDCRSCYNTGIFDGHNPDIYGNQNQWAIYDTHQRIALVEEIGRHQTQIAAEAYMLAAAPELYAALKSILAAVTCADTGRAEVVLTWNSDELCAARAAIAKAIGGVP